MVSTSLPTRAATVALLGHENRSASHRQFLEKFFCDRQKIDKVLALSISIESLKNVKTSVVLQRQFRKETETYITKYFIQNFAFYFHNYLFKNKATLLKKV